MPAAAQLLAAAAPADADLLARFAAGRDPDAFAELVRRHGPAVLGTCRRLVGRTDADDAFQATFLVLAARAGAVRKAASVGSWLIGVAGRVGRRMRLRARRQEAGDRGQVEPVCLLSPASCLLSEELSAALADEFTRLPDDLRAAAVACLLDGRTQAQAAAALGWSSRTVRRRLDEAKGLLRTRLERRGITPAAALAALATTAEPVPAALARTTADGAALFLAGGGADAAASALAHGVLGAMTTIRSTVAAAVCVAALAGLGVGWANDAAPPAEPTRIPAPAAKAAPAGPHVHKTANFAVTAPTAAAARALGEEFERQRKAVAVEWLGQELPAWTAPAAVAVRPHREAGWYAAELRFRGVPDAPLDATVYGGLDTLLADEAPRTATRLVLTTRLGQRLPRWLTSAVASGSTADAAVARCLDHLHGGRLLKLTTLFRGGGEKADWDVYEAQGQAVVQFLLARTPDLRHSVVEGGSHALTDPAPPLAPGQSAAKRGLLTFVESGGRLTQVFGFDTVERMEAAWLDWLRRNAPPADPPAAADPDRIPPPGAAPPAATSRQGVTSTDNFTVVAPSIQLAERVAVAAETHRRNVAKRWLGAELPRAAQPVAIRVTVTAGESGGATTFTFGEADGKRPPGVKSAEMELRGSPDGILKTVLPHEVTHVVLAAHFGRPLPRWADEGIAVLAETERDQFDHAVRARELLNAGRAIRLSTLFRLTEYPRDTVVTFAQGHSVCHFLLAHVSREAGLIRFLTAGMERNTAESWAAAAKEVYRYDSLDALEQAWIESLRTPPARP